MSHNNHIKLELQQISPLLANTSNRMPFAVPNGYFEQLPHTLLALAGRTEKEADVEAPAVPEGYFEQFAQHMLQKVRRLDWEAELAQIAPTLLPMNRQMPYYLAIGYFEQLADEIISKVTHAQPAQEEGFLNSLPRQMPYGVPKGYFSTLASSVLQQVQPGAELGVYHFEPPHTVQPRIETPYQVPPGYFESMAQEVLQKAKAAALPAVESKPWPTTMPYALPDGYFNQLENQIKEKIATLVPATTLLHHLRKKWVHYAAAAVLVLGALGVYKLVSITPQTQLPGDVAVELPQNQAGMDSLLQGLSLQLSTFEEESLGETLTDLGIPEDSRGPLFYLNTTNFEAALKDFSEEELQQQLVIQNADKASI